MWTPSGGPNRDGVETRIQGSTQIPIQQLLPDLLRGAECVDFKSVDIGPQNPGGELAEDDDVQRHARVMSKLPASAGRRHRL